MQSNRLTDIIRLAEKGECNNKIVTLKWKRGFKLEASLFYTILAISRLWMRFLWWQWIVIILSFISHRLASRKCGYLRDTDLLAYPPIPLVCGGSLLYINHTCTPYGQFSTIFGISTYLDGGRVMWWGKLKHISCLFSAHYR